MFSYVDMGRKKASCKQLAKSQLLLNVSSLAKPMCKYIWNSYCHKSRVFFVGYLLIHLLHLLNLELALLKKGNFVYIFFYLVWNWKKKGEREYAFANLEFS